ncbi:putative membrane protein [Volucribacter psittacicida]|uniref:Putative membrane protein n=1 Tax=Volucribacter psittacicida TaxID=203482 RepID=A0A4R1G546_9PAST|nr:TPM domain-containing protein [Volucribacter psittacicida]TCK01633.1 putative membrane protein [Volucribacter psittacicida]
MPLFRKPIPIDKSLIEQKIGEIEQKTSAELRVYIERKIAKNTSVLDRTLVLFDQLNMQETAQRNGVLVYLAFDDHLCGVLGDKGIHQYVGNDFWQKVNQQMIAHFKQQQYTQGILEALGAIGAELAKYFPIQADDIDELPNEVIIHD